MSTDRTTLRLSDERKRLLDQAKEIVASDPSDDPPMSETTSMLPMNPFMQSRMADRSRRTERCDSVNTTTLAGDLERTQSLSERRTSPSLGPVLDRTNAADDTSGESSPHPPAPLRVMRDTRQQRRTHRPQTRLTAMGAGGRELCR